MAKRSGGGRREEARETGFDCADEGYLRWRESVVEAAGREVRMVTRPGVPAFGVGLDPAAALLVDHLEVGAADTVLELGCGAGVAGTLAALQAPDGRVVMSDRTLTAVEAARRTLAANGVANAEVVHADGTAGVPEGFRADVALVRAPPGKLPALQLLWDAFHALRPGGRCYVAGANDEGVRTALKHAEALFGGMEVLGYRGGHRVGLAVKTTEAPVDAGAFDAPWLDHGRVHAFQAEVGGETYEVRSRPGVFSWDRLDAGSRALLETMEIAPGDEVLELGCGAGIVGTAAAVRGAARVTMVDVDAEAVRCAALTAEANGVGGRCEVWASDVGAALGERRFGVVVANPPFHVGKATDLDVPAQFIRDAARLLVPGGRLWLVANRTLPYERWIETCFGAFRMAHDGREFKVLAAQKR